MENNYKQKYIKYKNKYNILKGYISIPVQVGGSSFEGRPGKYKRDASNKKLEVLSIHFISKLKKLVTLRMDEFTKISQPSTIPNPAEMLIKLVDNI